MTLRAYNFNPGPCGLPDAVMEKAHSEFLVYAGERASVMEISHRGGAFMEVYARAESLLRELIGADDNYSVLFLSGGATGQAAAIPMNLIADAKHTASYAVTGMWSRRAADEGGKFCRVHLAACTESGGYSSLPDAIDTADGSAYLHYADNETVHGVEFPAPPDSSAPLVADMSSNILSRPIDLQKFGMVYAGAQKNLGATGVCIVVVKKSLLNPRPDTPMIWDYRKQHDSDSMANTPPTFNIYLTGLVLEWIKNEGGIAEMARRSDERARIVYDALGGGFYRLHANEGCRSRMNIPFFLPDDKLMPEFMAGATDNNMIGLKGHAALGGCRASLYNSMPINGAQKLADYLKEFAQRRG